MADTHGFPSFPVVDKAIAFGSFKPAAIASSNHFWNYKITEFKFKSKPLIVCYALALKKQKYCFLSNI